jgi:hypothetical protein
MMKKLLLSAAATAVFSLGSAAAMAAPVFTVNEGSVPGTSANTVVADLINGRYNEVLTINLNSTFDTTAYANFGQFFLGATGPIPSFLNNLGSDGYGLYALFQSSGNFAGSTFTGTSGQFSLYIDPQRNTTLSLGAAATGTTPVTVGGNADDYLIGSSNQLTSAFGVVTPTTGAFDLFFNNFTLTTGDQNAGTAGTQNGDLYFTAPRPFYLQVNVDGDFDTFVPEPSRTFFVNGDLSAIFLVPEPTSLALVGLALTGLGLSSRRRKA